MAQGSSNRSSLVNSVTIENFRCFGDRQTVPLAPLTLLVGPNSTGKTSFMALIRAMWDVAFRNEVPNFMEEPYNLGSFQDIAHRRGDSSGQPVEFGAGFEYLSVRPENRPISFSAVFENRTGTPFPAKRTISHGSLAFEVYLDTENEHNLQLHWDGGSFHRRLGSGHSRRYSDRAVLLPMAIAFLDAAYEDQPTTITEDGEEVFVMHQVTREGLPDLDPLQRMLFELWDHDQQQSRPFASAPIRSRPRRTYDPIRVTQDPEGEYIPSYLASLSRRRSAEWHKVKTALEAFGQGSGLFEEISVRTFGDTDGDPFQIMVRLPGDSSQVHLRNLMDVGYGVSQSLPVLTELLSDSAPSTYLLQQPEVHLHPTAQAALGSLFCNIAAKGVQMLVETHSDYLLDRVRMDVRDGKGEQTLKPEDVSILYFERSGASVRIYPIWLDENGNVRDAPDSYGEFFMSESRRSIGL